MPITHASPQTSYSATSVMHSIYWPNTRIIKTIDERIKSIANEKAWKTCIQHSMHTAELEFYTCFIVNVSEDSSWGTCNLSYRNIVSSWENNFSFEVQIMYQLKILVSCVLRFLYKLTAPEILCLFGLYICVSVTIPCVNILIDWKDGANYALYIIEKTTNLL